MLKESHYLVESPGGREVLIKAKNSNQAKRQACRYWGYKPNDPYCGITAMKARKIEMKGWDDSEKTERDTYYTRDVE